ncbi:MAG TPA: glycosyltransferase family 2 protein [Planctomycetota bacterium]|jgi:glycosyltransferase involved in cell wall biosynthesis
MISVLILTFNEDQNLPACLDSVKWSDDIVVFDSFSSDRTVEIARAAGARVLQRRFDDYGSQREAARTQSNFKHEWVLAVDADERVDSELAAEVLSIAKSHVSRFVAYRIARKDYFMDSWIKRSTLYPSWFVRFFQHQRIRYEPRKVHEYPTIDGLVGELRGHLLHYSFNKGLADWRQKHARYAEAEAAENLKDLRSRRQDLAGLLCIADPVRRRRALKQLSMRLPFRPTLRFMYMYLLRMGFLDGKPGLAYCRLMAEYERMIVTKMNELKRSEKSVRD